MAAAALTPRVRLMAVCDGVRESKIETGVFNLKGVRQSLAANVFPYTLSRLWLFLVLTCPRAGIFPGYAVVRHDRTGKAVFFAKLEPEPTFDEDQDIDFARLQRKCTFAEEGRYTCQIWFFREEGSGVLKGELPFHVGT
jgi:hypothetical protein